MKRIPEPELMDDVVQAQAYALADFSEPHRAFLDHFVERFPRYIPRRVVDLGCGPADVSLRFARAFPDCTLLGVEGAGAMIKFAQEAVERAALGKRIQLRWMRLRGTEEVNDSFDTVISNSLLHHLADPMLLWHAVRKFGSDGAAVFIGDLIRPNSRSSAAQLVTRYSGGEPEILRRDFFSSLLAAYRPEEVEDQLKQTQLPFRVEVVSDRHMVVFGYLPERQHADRGRGHG